MHRRREPVGPHVEPRAVGCRPHEDGRRRAVGDVPARRLRDDRASCRTRCRPSTSGRARPAALQDDGYASTTGRRTSSGHGHPGGDVVGASSAPRRDAGRARSSSERDAIAAPPTDAGGQQEGTRRRRRAPVRRRARRRMRRSRSARSGCGTPWAASTSVAVASRTRRSLGGQHRPRASDPSSGSSFDLLAQAGEGAVQQRAHRPGRAPDAPRPPPAPRGRRSSGGPPRVRWRTGSRSSASSSSRASRSATWTSSVAWWRRSRTRRRRWDRQALTTARRA